MKLILIACLAAVAAAAPQFQENPEYRQGDPNYRLHQDYRQRPHIAILRDEREDHRGDGNFRYEFETENGILVNAVGTPGSRGQSNIAGYYRFPLDDGTIAEVRYIADEFGYRPESPLIPTPHPLPAHALEQIRIAEQQRAAGYTWDQYGFRITR